MCVILMASMSSTWVMDYEEETNRRRTEKMLPNMMGCMKGNRQLILANDIEAFYGSYDVNEQAFIELGSSRKVILFTPYIFFVGLFIVLTLRQSLQFLKWASLLSIFTLAPQSMISNSSALAL